MTDEEMAEKSFFNHDLMYKVNRDERSYKEGFVDGLKACRPEWHKIFKGDPMCVEYWDLPQDTLPKVENFYFVKLKNGYIKICELKCDTFSRKKCFYDLHGGKQSNVAEWLDYSTIQGV